MSGPSGRLMGDLEQVWIVARYELLKHLRRRRILAVLAVTLLVAFLPFTIYYLLNLEYPPRVESFASNYVANSSLLIIIAGAFLAGDSIASEFDHKTGYILFPNPVRREILTLGKFLAALVAALIAPLLLYVVGVGALLAIYANIPSQLAGSLGFAALYTLSVLGLTFLFSSILKGSMGATLASFFTLFLILPIVGAVLQLTAYIEPWFLLTYTANAIPTYLDPSPTRVIETPGPGNRMMRLFAYPDFGTAALVMTLYFIIPLALSLLIARRKELT